MMTLNYCDQMLLNPIDLLMFFSFLLLGIAFMLQKSLEWYSSVKSIILNKASKYH